MMIYWEKDIYLPLNNHNHKFLMSWKLDTSKTLTVIRKLIEKLQERSPLNDSIVHNYASRSPVEMVLNKEECPLKFKRLIQRLCEMKRISDVVQIIQNYNIKNFLNLPTASTNIIFRIIVRKIIVLISSLVYILREHARYVQFLKEQKKASENAVKV